MTNFFQRLPMWECQGSRSSALRSQGTRTHFKIHFYPFLKTRECSHDILLSCRRDSNRNATVTIKNRFIITVSPIWNNNGSNQSIGKTVTGQWWKPINIFKPTVKSGILVNLDVIRTTGITDIQKPVFSVGLKMFTDFHRWPVIVTVASLESKMSWEHSFCVQKWKKKNFEMRSHSLGTER